LVLFAFVTTHLLNHALGIVSLQAAEAGRDWFTAFWRFPAVTMLLYGSLITHVVLALVALYRRRHLHIPQWEIIRLVLGLLIPLILIEHIATTRLLHELTGFQDTYTTKVRRFWVVEPTLGFLQVVLLIIAWVHGSLGLHYWLRVKPWHALTVPALTLLGPLLPILALFGFAAMGEEVRAQAAAPPPQSAPPPAAAPQERYRNIALGLYAGSVASVLAARGIRGVRERRRRTVRVTYPDGRRVAIAPGTTVLEASRAAGIPHASLCGGRGRCSTCRVRVGAGLDALPPPSADEARVLRRVGLPSNVRLACQTRPTRDVEVFPLLPPRAAAPADLLRPGQSAGSEREIAILFADIRAYTQFAEQRLPYDVVFILNEYFTAMGRAVERHGGYLDKFLGDGVMALFGIETGPEQGCRAALQAAAAMSEALDHLNRALANDLREPLRAGIGIHVGPVIVGEMGYGRAKSLTAIGDAVNTASRLEALTKEYNCQAIVSEDVAVRAGMDFSSFPSIGVALRGRVRPLGIHIIPDAHVLGGLRLAG
jgi:adenylate cyclase